MVVVDISLIFWEADSVILVFIYKVFARFKFCTIVKCTTNQKTSQLCVGLILLIALSSAFLPVHLLSTIFLELATECKSSSQVLTSPPRSSGVSPAAPSLAVQLTESWEITKYNSHFPGFIKIGFWPGLCGSLKWRGKLQARSGAAEWKGKLCAVRKILPMGLLSSLAFFRWSSNAVIWILLPQWNDHSYLLTRTGFMTWSQR